VSTGAKGGFLFSPIVGLEEPTSGGQGLCVDEHGFSLWARVGLRIVEREVAETACCMRRI
jgi:hypothetical protein